DQDDRWEGRRMWRSAMTRMGSATTMAKRTMLFAGAKRSRVTTLHWPHGSVKGRATRSHTAQPRAAPRRKGHKKNSSVLRSAIWRGFLQTTQLPGDRPRERAGISEGPAFAEPSSLGCPGLDSNQHAG